MPLTLKDIARKAGVAESTVSRAINNKPGVGEETRKKILKIAEKYNYKPNQLAQGLAKQETHIIALFISDFDNPACTEIMKNIEKEANDSGYQVILCNTDNNPEKEKKYFQLLKRNIVDGAIIVGGKLTDKNILNTVLKDESPLVLVNRFSEELLIPTILIDNARGAYIATKHLLEQNLERIAIIMGPGEEYLESEKLNGYYQALNEFNIPVNQNLIIETEINRQGGYNSFLKLIDLNNPPEGFFVTRGIMAIGLVEAIKMGGYFIPEDFSVVGYGDTLISSIINPPLTVVSEPLNELGKRAAQYLIKILNNQSLSPVINVLDPVINVRDSSIPGINIK